MLVTYPPQPSLVIHQCQPLGILDRFVHRLVVEPHLVQRNLRLPVQSLADRPFVLVVRIDENDLLVAELHDLVQIETYVVDVVIFVISLKKKTRHRK